jgi:tetratricopeptide (TPR) repeat protein
MVAEDFDEAEAQFAAAAEDPELSAEANVRLGRARHSQGRADEALEAYETAFSTVTTEEERLLVHYWRGLLHWHGYQLEDAAADLEVAQNSADEKLADDARRALTLIASGSGIDRFFRGEAAVDEPPLPLVIRFHGHVSLHPGWIALRVQRLDPEMRLAADDILIEDDDEVMELRTRLNDRVANVKSDPYWSPEFEHMVRGSHEDVERYDNALREGIAAIINELYLERDVDAQFTGVAAHWFARIARSSLLGVMYSAQNPDVDRVAIDREALVAPSTDFHRFFDVDSDMTVVVAPAPAELDPTRLFERYVKARIPGEGPLQDALRQPPAPLARADLTDTELLARFVAPQAVFNACYGGDFIFWDYDNVIVGID